MAASVEEEDIDKADIRQTTSIASPHCNSGRIAYSEQAGERTSDSNFHAHERPPLF